MGEMNEAYQRGSENTPTRTTAAFTDVDGTFSAVRERKEYTECIHLQRFDVAIHVKRLNPS